MNQSTHTRQKPGRTLIALLLTAASMAGIGSAQALAAPTGEAVILGEWTLNGGHTGKISVTGGPGSYVGYVSQPVMLDCLHPVGEPIWTMSYTGSDVGGGSPSSTYYGGELWYTESCEPFEYGPAGFSVGGPLSNGSYYLAMCTKSPTEPKRGCSSAIKKP